MVQFAAQPLPPNVVQVPPVHVVPPTKHAVPAAEPPIHVPPTSQSSSASRTPSPQRPQGGTGGGPDTQPIAGLHDSGPLQAFPSSGQLSIVPVDLHDPLPSHWSTVHLLPSASHSVEDGSKQLCVASWQVLHCVPEQGSPL